MYIFYLYVQTVTRQCFCFPNSQWGVTAHDIPPQREDRKLDILENISFLSVKQKHAMERRYQYYIYTKCSSSEECGTWRSASICLAKSCIL